MRIIVICLISSFISGVAFAELPSDSNAVVGYWLDENAGTHVTNWEGTTAYNGDLKGGLTAADWISGPNGADDYGLEWSGAAGEYIDINDCCNFGNGTTDSPFSVYSVGKFDTFSETSKAIISKALGVNQIQWRFRVYDGNMLVDLYDNVTDNYIRTYQDTQFSSATWHSLSFSYDGLGLSSGIKLYIDGVEVDSTDSDNSYTAMHTVTTDTLIGTCFLGEGYESMFEGEIACVLVYDYELTSSNMLSLHEAHAGAETTDLSAYYRRRQ